MPPAMEDSTRSIRSLNRSSSRHKRSGYEPSDTETEWQESPWNDGLLLSNRSRTPDPARIISPIANRSRTPDPARIISSISNRSITPDPMRTISPLNRTQRYTLREDNDNSASKASGTSPGVRRHSRSPYKPIRHGETAVSYMTHSDQRRNTSPFKASEHRNVSPFKASEHRNTSPLKASERRNASPYKVSEHRHTSPFKVSEHCHTNPFKISEHRNTSPFKVSEQRNTSPFKVSEHRNKHVSPYRSRREEHPNHEIVELDGSSWKRNQRTPPKRQNPEDNGGHLPPQEDRIINERSCNEIQEVSRMSERSNHNRCRSISRAKEREQHVSSGAAAPGAERRPSPLAKTIIRKESDDGCTEHTPYEINETNANMKLSKSPSVDALLMQSTESVSLSDIFVSRDCMALQKESTMKLTDKGDKFVPQLRTYPEKNIAVQQLRRGTGSFNQNPQGVSVTTALSQTNASASSAFGRSSNGRSSTFSGKLSDSGKLSGSFKKITAIRQRAQTDTWLSCVRGGSCAKTKSPDYREIDETSFIERALVVEELRPFLADKHRPCSLSKFICHKQQAQHLKQLISHNDCPHILFKGPSGAGKKALSMAFLHEIFGYSSWKTSDDLRHYNVQETRPMQIAVPLTSSPHHVELNLKSESKNARYALMALVKEITSDRTVSPEVSDVSFKADYKVIILYNFDKVPENVQHLVKWIMDRHTDACKIILCCEDDADILDSVKTRCKLIAVDAPVTHEIMEVLIQIANKENFELSVSFAARIATKSKQNLRKAIMALEACKAHNYPFVDEQPIPLGWEEIVEEISREILADPSAKRLFFVRGKFQKLLVEFVSPKLILQKLVEQFLKRVEADLKRELYYWHAYYEKRLPTGTSALLKLEEFLAKFMSIYRKSSALGPQFV